MTMLQIEKLTIKASVKKQAASLLSITAAQLQPGLCVVIGPNGAGKTSLLKGIAQLLPIHGDIQLNTRSIGKQSRLWRAQHIAYLAQHNVLAWPITSQQAIDLGRLPHSAHFVSDSKSWIEALDLTYLKPKSMNHLSGGELARVHLARAMTTHADLTLLDEPLAHLDIRHQHLALHALRNWCHAHKKIIVLSLHQLDMAYQYADTLWLLNHGELVWQGSPIPTQPEETQRMRKHLDTAFEVKWAWIDSNNRSIPFAHVQSAI